jgi:glucosylceramidase
LTFLYPLKGIPMRRRHLKQLAAALGIGLTVAAAAVLPRALASAAEPVNVWLTTTTNGQTVTRGLAQQAPIAFADGTGSGQQITVNDGARFQQFTGGGASITDTTGFLMNQKLSAAARTDAMTKLFSPTAGIGVSFLRNPMGSSDLARNDYAYDQTCCDLNDFSLAKDVDVMALTKQAKALNPALSIMANPWSAPAWMKDNNSYVLGNLQSQYYNLYAQYFVKYVQGYQAAGVPIDYVGIQNEPTCCGGNAYASMNWNASGQSTFIKSSLWPAFRAAGITTKTLLDDWNFDSYANFGAPLLADSAIRTDPLLGGVAFHGYSGSADSVPAIHNQYPAVKFFETERTGCICVGDQQGQDMSDMFSFLRNYQQSFVKWSLAVDQDFGPTTGSGGCAHSTCTGLITVHNGDSRNGQVDYTVEYYTMGHLTKFVKPGATRVDSTSNNSVKNVAFQNPDGSHALIAYNSTGSAQTVRVNYNGQSFSYSLPTHTTATFTWGGTVTTPPTTTPPTTTPPTTTPPTGTPHVGPITGIAGKCVDVAGASSANGTKVQLFTCNGTGAQTWTVGTDNTLRSLGKCMDVTAASTANGAKIQLFDCNGTTAQKWTASNGTLINTGSGKCLDSTNNSSADGNQLQIWTCGTGANQKWNLPA